MKTKQRRASGKHAKHLDVKTCHMEAPALSFVVIMAMSRCAPTAMTMWQDGREVYVKGVTGNVKTPGCKNLSHNDNNNDNNNDNDNNPHCQVSL